MVNTNNTLNDNFTVHATVNNSIAPPDQSVNGSFCIPSQNPSSRFAGLLIEYRHLDGADTDMQARFCRCCEEQLTIYHIGYCYVVCDSCICFYLCFDNYGISELADLLRQNLAESLRNYPVNIYYSGEVTSLEEAKRQLDYLMQQLRYSQIYGYGRLFSYQQIYNAQTGRDCSFRKNTLTIEEKLLREDYHELTRYLEQLCLQITASGSVQSEELYSYHSLYLLMETILYLFKFHFRKNVWDSPLNSLTLPELLLMYPGFEKYIRFLGDCIAEYQTNRETDPANQRRQSMAKFQNYIDQNLATVTLNSLAEHFQITPAYLSRTFKRNVGQNFSEYLSECKLQKAALLLEQGFRINDITKQLGYASPAYFLSKFKKKYGMAPSVYRKRLLSYKTDTPGEKDGWKN